MPKQAPNLGFELDELEQTVDRYRDPSSPAPAPKAKSRTKKPAASPRRTRKASTTTKKLSPATATPATRVGRPRTLPDSRSCSFRLTEEQYVWLLKEAANRTLSTDQRHDASMLVRELIDQARGAS